MRQETVSRAIRDYQRAYDVALRIQSNVKYVAALEAKLTKLGGRVLRQTSHSTYGSMDVDSPLKVPSSSGNDLISLEGQNNAKAGFLARLL